jgi:hypothetical protein
MQRCGNVLGALIVAAVLTAAVVGCAEGAGSDEPAFGTLASTPVDKGKGEEEGESVKLPPPSNPPAPAAEEDAGTEDSGNNNNGSDAGTDSGNPPPPPPPPPTTSCNAPSACSGATDLGTVSGDKNADQKSAQGSTSQWLKVRVTENDSDVFGMDLWTKVTLTQPSGGQNFDLYVYLPGSDILECSAVTKSSTTGGTETVSLSWGEGSGFSNGKNDDRWVTIEVRHVSGTCDPNQKWSLLVEGNKN